MNRDSRSLNPAYFELDEKFCEKYKPEIFALKAVWEGKATKDQQVRALSFVLDALSNRAGNQFYSTDRETAFASGKKWVGDMIVGLIKVKTGNIKGD